MIVRREVAEERIEVGDDVVADADEQIEIVAVDGGGVLDLQRARVLARGADEPRVLDPVVGVAIQHGASSMRVA